MPKRDGLSVCRLSAPILTPASRDPIVLITAQSGAENTAMGFAARNDYLTKPFVPPHLRTRVRSWLMRTAVPPATGGL